MFEHAAVKNVKNTFQGKSCFFGLPLKFDVPTKILISNKHRYMRFFDQTGSCGYWLRRFDRFSFIWMSQLFYELEFFFTYHDSFDLLDYAVASSSIDESCDFSHSVYQTLSLYFERAKFRARDRLSQFGRFWNDRPVRCPPTRCRLFWEPNSFSAP